MSTLEFFYRGNRITGWLFTLPVSRFIALFSGLALTMLLLSSTINIHSIPCQNRNYGFWFKYSNWSVLYVVILPIIFATMVVLSERIKSSVLKLCCDPLNVITKKSAGNVPDYPNVISERMAKAARPIAMVTLILALTIVAIDTHDLWTGYYRDRNDNGKIPATIQPDWDTAYTGFAFDKYESYCGASTGPCNALRCENYRPPHRPANLLFDIIPYSFETIVIYLALFWVSKFYWFLNSFSALMRFDDSPYQFNPLDNPEDPDTRMGLRPMGRIFNGFLFITVLFQGYIFANRLELISLSRTDSSRWQIFKGLLVSPTRADFSFETVSHSQWMLILFMGVPIIVICYFPLWTLYRYVRRRRYEAWEANARAFADAIQRKDNDLAEELKGKMNVLQNANVWPNGDATARRFLIVMVILATASVVPPVLPYMLGAGIVGEGVLTIWKRWERKDVMRMKPSQTLQQIFIERFFSMDKHIDNKGIYIQGDNAHIHDIDFSQVWHQHANSIDLQKLSDELKTLREELARQAMQTSANQAQRFTEVAAVAAAEEEASKGKGAKALEYLSKAGNWTLEIATKIGVPIAVEALKKSMGL